MQCIIYAITNIVTKRRYVGSTVNAENRWKQHQSLLKQKRHHCAHLQNSYNKHGAENFTFSIIRILITNDSSIRRAAEIEEIAKLPSFNSLKANIDLVKFECSPELRAKMAASIKKAWQNPNTLLRTPVRTHWDDPQARGKHSQIMKGRYADPEERKRTAEATKRGQTEEVRKRKSEASALSWQDPNGRQRTTPRPMTPEGMRIKKQKSAAFWASPEGQAERAKRRQRLLDFWSKNDTMKKSPKPSPEPVAAQTVLAFASDE